MSDGVRRQYNLTTLINEANLIKIIKGSSDVHKLITIPLFSDSDYMSQNIKTMHHTISNTLGHNSSGEYSVLAQSSSIPGGDILIANAVPFDAEYSYESLHPTEHTNTKARATKDVKKERTTEDGKTERETKRKPKKSRSARTAARKPKAAKGIGSSSDSYTDSSDEEQLLRGYDDTYGEMRDQDDLHNEDSDIRNEIHGGAYGETYGETRDDTYDETYGETYGEMRDQDEAQSDTTDEDIFNTVRKEINDDEIVRPTHHKQLDNYFARTGLGDKKDSSSNDEL